MASILSAIPSFSLDSLLSIPFISYFILPTLSASWPTSLNFIFFTLLWTTIVWSYRPLLVELYAICAVRLIFYVAPCAGFLAFDAALPAVTQSFKAHGGRALPLRAVHKPGVGPKSRLSFVVGVALGNILLAVAVQTLIEAFLTEVLHTRSALRMSAVLPAPWSLVKDVVKAMAVRGVLTYYIHRFLLHAPRRSPLLSRGHREYAHSLNATLPFSAAFDHPLAFLLLRWLPLYLTAFYYRFHLITHLVTLAVAGLEEALVYSGYAVLPSTILLTGMARRQEKHLATGGRGNFGPYGFLDWLHGTSIDDYDVFDDIRAEADRHDVKGKAHKALDKADGALRPDDGGRNASEQRGASDGLLKRMTRSNK